MANGKVSINSDIVNQVLSQINSSQTTLESSVSGKIPGDFQVLVDIGLLPSAVDKIKKQVNDLVAVHNSITSQISSHIQKSVQTEDNLSNEFKNNYGNNNNNYLGGNSSSSINETDVNIDSQDDGKNINANVLIENIPNINNETMLGLIEFLNINKNQNTSLIDLLIDTNNSEELFVLLRKAFGANNQLEGVSLDDYKKVQKTLLDAIINSDISCPILDKKTIICAKEYLIEFCKSKNINPSDLLIDEKNRDLLKVGLQQLYDANGINNISEKTVNNFRNYVDSVAISKNIEVEKLLSDNIEVLL